VKLFGAGNHSFTTGDIATSNITLDASGSTGTNTLSAATFATNGVSITGGSGADTITGSGQADVIVGGAGIDTINATAGADAITLGAGNDIVVYTLTAAVTLGNLSNIATLDTISDFVTGSDKLHFDDAAVTALAKASSAQLTAIQNAVDGLAAGSTLTQAVAAAATALNVDNSAVTAGSIYSFTFGGNTFVAVDSTIANGTASATDTLLVQLTGITSVDLTNDITII
jgi:Ca2+-binding RTX toxin-like protein